MSLLAARPLIDLDLPDDFHEVPLERALEDRVHAQAALLDRLRLPDLRRREGLGWYLEALSRGASDEGVAATAFCAVLLDGEASAATLTVAVHDADADDPLVLALGAAESLRQSGRYDHVATERVGHTLAAVARADGPGRTHHLTAVVPVAGHRLSVVLCLGTADAPHADVYDRVLRRVAASVRVVA